MEYKTFLKNCLTPHHTAELIKNMCMENGMTQFNFKDDIRPGRFFYIYNTLIVLFDIPDTNTFKGFRIVGTHSDSPVLKLRTNPLEKHENIDIVNLKTYGGGLWHTWFDRNLGICGYSSDENIGVFKIETPSVYIPSLAIHSARDIYENGFIYDKDKHLRGILQTDISNYIKKAHDISLYDTSDPIIADKLIYSARQDNISSTFCGVKSFLQCKSPEFVNILAIYDYEEVGSSHLCGAEGTAIWELMQLIAKKYSLCYSALCSDSLIISADAAHATHFNYLERFEKNHSIQLGGGVVIKHSNRYATDVFSSSKICSIAEKMEVKLQSYELKNKSPSGGTIGPMISTRTGIITVDLGVPLLGMHSIREVCHIDDINALIWLFNGFFSGCE